MLHWRYTVIYGKTSTEVRSCNEIVCRSYTNDVTMSWPNSKSVVAPMHTLQLKEITDDQNPIKVGQITEQTNQPQTETILHSMLKFHTRYCAPYRIAHFPNRRSKHKFWQESGIRRDRIDILSNNRMSALSMQMQKVHKLKCSYLISC